MSERGLLEAADLGGEGGVGGSDDDDDDPRGDDDDDNPRGDDDANDVRPHPLHATINLSDEEKGGLSDKEKGGGGFCGGKSLRTGW